ncbi:MAG: 2-amino-4-oxopentanoate thiolase subunit OrtB [Defluviitaleaceae bacterium]|nr:2-amino-4-oxopentanoate thiolase subunit OrtB [Defluviitaleaceae bacterium]
MDYKSVMARKSEILKGSIGIDFTRFESGSVAFDYENMMDSIGYSFEEIQNIQRGLGVGNTPLIELRNITALARKCANQPGFGARIFIKDEAANPSGSFKDRRAATAVYHAKKLGYKGVAAATSGNYGAAVASQAAAQGLGCIIVQECFDSRKIGQPEILEKTRKCEAFGAEVIQMTVGPELFYKFLLILEETGYFSASLYSPFGVAGVETLGTELVQQMREITAREGKPRDPDAVIVTHAGGGNITGTARGLRRENCNAKVIAASVNLKGLHMASDKDFNRKSFTTGHTGFGFPFATWPDRSDMPRSAARPLRYIDRYVLVNQGEVFYMTELLANLEGLERGPAGNTSLCAAFSLAQNMREDEIIVVQETEYTGAGKHIQPQLSFARQNGIEIKFGDPADEIPGQNIILPEHPGKISVREVDLNPMRKSLIRNTLSRVESNLTAEDISFLAAETNRDENFIKEQVRQP